VDRNAASERGIVCGKGSDDNERTKFDPAASEP
jgi:hypothetical protein